MCGRSLHSSFVSHMLLISSCALLVAAVITPSSGAERKPSRESYKEEPVPSGIQVIDTELEGPVYANAEGATLYIWPRINLRNGDAGDVRNRSSLCNDKVLVESAGLQSPWPPGLLLPDIETRPSCAEVWPPLIASSGSQPVGNWTLGDRENGTKQWLYGGMPVYTSVLDKQPGDTYGATKRRRGPDAPALRMPLAPLTDLPAAFAVAPTALGRLLVTSEGYSVYAREPSAETCSGSCLNDWEPLFAPKIAKGRGEWSAMEYAPGVLQWAFRGEALFVHKADDFAHSLQGGDVRGWHNVYIERAPTSPAGFTVQDTRGGQVLATRTGNTIYVYNCGDDSVDQLACDHPDTTQVMRFAICGDGKPDLCRQTFPYVIADRGAVSPNRAWTIKTIDPKTGHLGLPDQKGSLRVWAYRDRPVYTFGRDEKPGDVKGDAWGEFTGRRNGFKAFWLRDDFLRGNAD